MKGPHCWRCQTRISHRRGAALLIALSFLVLMSVVVLAFFSSARHDRQNAGAFASGQETLRLAETAVNLVQGQIRDATTRRHPTTNLVGSWASQPGMVRSFDEAGASTAYKLYSSDAMVVGGFGKTEMDAEVTDMANWNTQPAHFVDLNSPAVVKRPDPASSTGGYLTTPVFPIVDPRAYEGGAAVVEGFSYTGSVPSVVAPPASGSNNSQRLPMPVKWIYVLKDGQLLAPASAAGATRTATFSGTVPTQLNPVVGRIAFWADDDTAKLNINTASEGSFWDLPRSVALNEAKMGWAIPVKGEFQAIAGHPATTSLSSVIGTLVGTPASALPPFGMTAANYTSYFAPYYGIAPRLSDTTTTGKRTTQGGTQQTTIGSVTGMGLPVVYDTDRLYATTDELLFKPDRTLNVAALTAAQLARRDFFLTASSRAPETTLFGTPRISLWPFQRLPTANGSPTQTPRDQLLSFCSKVGANSYAFERFAIAVGPGTGTTPSGRSISDDYTKIARNQDLYAYLGRLLDKPVPGFGSKFSDKWSVAGNAQVATMAYDYLRCGLNLFQSPSGGRNGANSWGYEVPVPVGGTQGGYIVPIKIGNTRGFGRNTTITEAAIVFLATAADVDPVSPNYRKTTKMQAVMMFNLFRPTPNSAAAPEGIRFKVAASFGSDFSISGELRDKTRSGSGTDSGRNFAFVGTHMMFFKSEGNINPPNMRTVGNSNIDTEYPFVSPEIAVSGSTFSFPGGPVTIDIYEPDTATPQIIQTLKMNFDPVILPLPQAVNSSGGFDANEARTFGGRLAANLGHSSYMRCGDLARSVRFSNDSSGGQRGDLRLLCLKESVPVGWFQPHPSYSNPVIAYAFDASGNAASATSNADARKDRFAQSLRSDWYGLRNGWQYGWSDNKNAAAIASGVNSAALGAGFDNTLVGNNKILPGGLLADLRMSTTSNTAGVAVTPPGLTAARTANGLAGDFTSNYGFCADGATIQVPDFGTLQVVDSGGFYTELTWGDDKGEGIEPNRQAPSPVIFGTLPAVDSTGNPAPWQTLLFCPCPSAGNNHPGFGSGVGGSGPAARAPFSLLPDHLFLDLWWMPAVDPYAVSEPLATAGKINLNYQIAPFTYITRSTGIQALMKSVKLAGVPDSRSADYKQQANGQNAWTGQTPFSNVNVATRFNLNMSATDGSLKGFEDRFAAGDIFRSASEICMIPLVASGETVATMASAWWPARRLTGDNLREAPYNALYSRVTTKSNTFTVHFRVQVLKQVPRGGRKWEEWQEGKDAVVGEYRGSTTMERFLDPNAANIPDYATIDLAASTYSPIDQWYRWRVLSEKQFAP